MKPKNVSPLFLKLNFTDQKEILVLEAPSSMGPELRALPANIVTVLEKGKSFSFIMIFVTTQKKLISLATKLNGALAGDGMLWVCYPKKTSPNYQSDITRDNDWSVYGQLGFESVRIAAIDADWSGLRLRRAEYIPVMKRDRKRAISSEGKIKTAAKKK